MCESTAYIVKRDGTEEVFMESVDYIKPDGGAVLLRSIFGEEKTIDARIAEMNLTKHRILLAPSGE